VQLSERQLRVAELAAQGYSNRDIASELNVTEQVVKNILHSVFDRLGIWNRVELANRLLQGESLTESHRRIETERIAELHKQQILDTKAELFFDEITKIAVTLFNVPVALVTLVDSSRVWFKSNIGLSVSEIPRELSLCHHTIQQSQILSVSYDPQDPHFECNPFLKEYGVRFYAAAPILTVDGYALGVVCIVDSVPRTFEDARLSVLTSLARLASQQIQLRRELFAAHSVQSEPARGSLLSVAE
jgi:GAF domain-containing protein